MQSLCLLSDSGQQLVTQVEMQLIPDSEPVQLLLKNVRDSAGSLNF
jgi:hypothetical protein